MRRSASISISTSICGIDQPGDPHPGAGGAHLAEHLGDGPPDQVEVVLLDDVVADHDDVLAVRPPFATASRAMSIAVLLCR